MLQRPNIAINRYVTKSIYFSEFSTMQDQTNMQRPAYCVLGHSPLRFRDQYVVTKDGNASTSFSFFRRFIFYDLHRRLKSNVNEKFAKVENPEFWGILLS